MIKVRNPDSQQEDRLFNPDIASGQADVANTFDESDAPRTSLEPEEKQVRARKPSSFVIWIALCIIALNSVTIVWLVINRGGTTIMQLGSSQNGSGQDTSDVLSIDTKTKSLGIGAPNPQGLQVGSSIGIQPRGSANIRVGLLHDSPQLVFENSDGLQWQLGLAGDRLQYGKVGEAMTELGSLARDSLVLGANAQSVITMQASAINAPNNLAIDDGTLFIDTTGKRVAVGSRNAQGFKLHVTGNARVTAGLEVGGQLLVDGGSAVRPGYSFTGVANSGLFAQNGAVGISVGGRDVLRAQSGSVVVSALETDGFVRAGRGADNPAWQLKRLTGTLNAQGEASVAHGVSSNRILMVSAWYLDNSGNARSVFDSFNGSSVQLTNGLAGKPYRVTIIYSADGAAW